MPCEGKNLAYIHFKYPGEEQQTIKSTNPPVNHQCKFDGQFEGGQCPTFYNVIFRRQWRWNSSSGVVVDNNEGIGQNITGPISAYRVTRINDEWHFQVYAEGAPSRNFLGWHTIGTLDGSYLDPAFESFRVVRTDQQPDNCGNPTSENKYKFEVTDATRTIYSRIANTCPIVNIKCGESCPLGTCECDCGTVICCYNDNGISVKSFAK